MALKSNNTKSPANSDATDAPAADTHQEPSLGPACAFFFLFFCVVGSIALIATAWYISGNQSQRAASALRSQLIPWVEGSSLSDPDRSSIIERLNVLVADMDNERLSEQQLSRLNFRLSGAPIFQWGVIDQILAAAHASEELSPKEKEDLVLETDRLLRTVQNNRLSMEQLQFATQTVAKQEVKTGRLSIRDGVSAKEIQEFARRITSINDEAKTVKGNLDKSVSQVFRFLMDEALEVPAPR